MANEKQGRVDLHCIAMKWSQSNEVVWLSNRIALGKRSNDTNFYSNHISNFPAKHLQWLNLHHRSFSRASPANRVDIYVPIPACNGPLTVALHRFSVCNFTCVEEDPGKFFWNLFVAKGSRITLWLCIIQPMAPPTANFSHLDKINIARGENQNIIICLCAKLLLNIFNVKKPPVSTFPKTPLFYCMHERRCQLGMQPMVLFIVYLLYFPSSHVQQYI